MNTKIYLIICDEDKVFKEFIANISRRIPGIATRDYHYLKFNSVNSAMNSSLNIYDSKDNKLVRKLSNIINNYNSSLFDKLIISINNIDYKSIYLFVKVETLYEMNQLRRILKRPNYKTVFISHSTPISKKLTSLYSNYKFDSKIQYVDNKHLIKQANMFIRKHMPTFNFIHNE